MGGGILSQLDLSGLIHIWGLPASGKTLFAVAVAAVASRDGHVIWINCDGKRGFLQPFRKAVDQHKGIPNNVTVSLPNNRDSVLQSIIALPTVVSDDDDVTLIVIDPITRVLDMARTDPILWGRELIEDALPTLAGLVLGQSIDVVIISESRMLIDTGTVAVHHASIKRWADHDIHIQRGVNAGRSDIILEDDPFRSHVIGTLVLNSPSGLEVTIQRPIAPPMED